MVKIQTRFICTAVLLLWSATSVALPDEWIFVHGFERGSRIVFDGDSSALFTASDQSRALAVRVEDAAQNEIPDPAIHWYLDGGSEYQLNGMDGSSTTVLSSDFAVGSAHLYAIDLGTGLSAVAIIAMGSLQPDAQYLGSELVVSGNTPMMGVGEIVLMRNTQTEALTIGSVLVTDDAAGLLVRIVDIPTAKGDDIRMTVEPAKLTDAFETLRIEAQSESVRRRYQLNDDPAGRKMLSEDLECETGGETAIGFDISGPTVDLTFELSVQAELDLSGGEVQTFLLALVAEAGLAAETGTLTYTSNVSTKVTCTFQLPEIFTPALPVSAFSFQLNTAPTIGFEFEAGFSGPSFSIMGPSGSVSGNARAGIQYAAAGGWSPVSETGWAGSFQPLSTEFDANISFTAKGGPFVANEFGLVANLGRPPLGLQLADLRFVRLKGLGELEFQLSTPLNPERKDYVGPQWDIDAILTGQYQAALADGLLFSLLNALNIPTQIDALTGDIFSPIEIRIAESPKPSLSLSCLPSCPLNPANGESAELTMTASTTNTGLATFVAAMNGSNFVSDLTSAGFSGGQAVASWSPTEQEEGTFEIYPRLVTDALSQLFPYGSDQGQAVTVRSLDLPIVFQGAVDALAINSAGKVAFVAQRNECWGGRAVFIDNAIYACPPSQSWFVDVFRPLHLTNKAYFNVLSWQRADDNYQGIFKGPMTGTEIDSCWSQDTVIAGPFQGSQKGHFLEDAANNGDVAWIHTRDHPSVGSVSEVRIRTSESCSGLLVDVSRPRSVRISGSRNVVVATRDRILAWDYPPEGWVQQSRKGAVKGLDLQPPATILVSEDQYVRPAFRASVNSIDVNNSGLTAFIYCYDNAEFGGNEVCDVGTVSQGGSIGIIDSINEDLTDTSVTQVRIADNGQVAYCKRFGRDAMLPDGTPYEGKSLFVSSNVLDPFAAEGHRIGSGHLIASLDCGRFDFSSAGLVFSGSVHEIDDIFAGLRGVFKITTPLLFPQ